METTNMQKILEKAARQFQHDDCSGFVRGFDYEETIKIVSDLIEAYKLARNAAIGVLNHCEYLPAVNRCEKMLEKAEAIKENLEVM